MNPKSFFSSLVVSAIIALAFAFVFITPAQVSAVTTTTTTVIGWLFPDPSHSNNAIGAMLFPIVGVGLFAGLGMVIGLEGDFGVTLILAGLTIGGVLAMLSINASSSNVLPFALVVVPAFDLILWLWKGGG